MRTPVIQQVNLPPPNSAGGTVAKVARNISLASIIPTTNLLAWWDAERSVWSDTGLTTRATDGGAVAGWSDQGSSGLHVTQSVSGDRPLYRSSVAAFGGKPGIEFVSSDFLSRESLAGGVAANLTTYSIFIVYAGTAAVMSCLYSEGRTSSSVPFVSVRHNAGAANFNCQSDASVLAVVNAGSGANDGTAKVITLRRIAANSWSLRLNGTEVGTDNDNVGTTTINRLAIGTFARAANSFFFTGHIAQVLLYSSDNFATIEPSLKSHYGIP